MFRIALDAGHGKNTAGKRCDKKIDPNQTREWVLNARIAELVELGLQKYSGYELLRLDDPTGKKDVALSTRCKNANKFKANIFLSIHHNAGIKGGAGGGIVVYTWNKPNAELQKWQKLLYDNLIAETGLKGNRATPLAKNNYYVLVNTDMQALLIENGFMDSTTDTPIILTDAHAQKTANAIVKTIAAIGGLKKKQTKYAVNASKTVTNKETAEKLVKKLKNDGFTASYVKC